MRALAATLVAALGFIVGLPSECADAHHPRSETQVDTIRVEAFIDGRSQLVVQGSTAQWRHIDFAAPGRWEFRDEPTLINDVEWFPVWPDVPDRENRFCDCSSDVFSGVDPPLPSFDAAVELRILQSRHVTSVVQEPMASNGYTLIVEFNDNPPPGAAWYVVEIDVSYLTPTGAVRLLRNDVRQLVVDGTLSHRHGRFLQTPLDRALGRLHASRDLPASRQLGVFVRRVEVLERRGVLDSERAQPLIDRANQVIDRLRP